MIITRLKIQNLYCFLDNELDLTFTKKPLSSTVEHEYLTGREKFYFKKVCILSGANATGKTSLARILCAVQNFISRNSLPEIIKGAIAYPDKPATLEIEFVTTEIKPLLHQLTLTLTGKEEVIIDKLEYANAYIRKNDSVNLARRQLQKVIENKGKKRDSRYLKCSFHSTDEKDILARSEFLEIQQQLKTNWQYSISHFDNKSAIEITNRHVTTDILNKILQTFDPSIDDVQETITKKTAVGFSIFFKNGEDPLILDNTLEHTPSKLDRLSTGTIDAIEIAKFFAYQKEIANYSDKGTFYLDEKMSHAHNILEQAMLNLLINALPKHGQLFYTTHNYDILDMNLPIHSYIFLKKVGERTEIINPLEKFKKNDRSLVNYVKNDVFGTIPSTEKLESLLEETEEDEDNN